MHAHRRLGHSAFALGKDCTVMAICSRAHDRGYHALRPARFRLFLFCFHHNRFPVDVSLIMVMSALCSFHSVTRNVPFRAASCRNVYFLTSESVFVVFFLRAHFIPIFSSRYSSLCEYIVFQDNASTTSLAFHDSKPSCIVYHRRELYRTCPVECSQARIAAHS